VVAWVAAIELSMNSARLVADICSATLPLRAIIHADYCCLSQLLTSSMRGLTESVDFPKRDLGNLLQCSPFDRPRIYFGFLRH
jgi:hypothetical protein